MNTFKKEGHGANVYIVFSVSHPIVFVQMYVWLILVLLLANNGFYVLFCVSVSISKYFLFSLDSVGLVLSWVREFFFESRENVGTVGND